MIKIYYNDGVNPGISVHKCTTIEEAKGWINEQLKGYTMVDDDHMCSEDVMESAKTGLYEVYDKEPITIHEDGVPYLANPVYVSVIFYTE